MMGVVWCFCNHSVTANFELLDSAAKESHHTHTHTHTHTYIYIYILFNVSNGFSNAKSAIKKN